MTDETRLTTCPATAREVLISVNPKAGRSDSHEKVERFVELLRELQMHPEVISDLKELEHRATERFRSGHLRTVVAAGGDGTASLIASMFAPQIPMTLLPLGTENLLAKYLMLHGSLEVVAQAVADGQAIHLDCGKANGKLFLVMASCGFDADVVDRLHRRRKGHIHHLSYAKPILKSIANYRYPKLQVQLDDQEPYYARWAFVFNVPKYAMKLPIAADASSIDGLLDVCTFRRGNLFHGMKYLLGIIFRQHHRFTGTKTGRAQKIRIDAGQKKVPFQLDGDPGGQLPVTIEVLAKHLNVVVPKSWIAKYETDLTSDEERVQAT